jgi:hypothetical protein
MSRDSRWGLTACFSSVDTAEKTRSKIGPLSHDFYRMWVKRLCRRPVQEAEGKGKRKNCKSM